MEFNTGKFLPPPWIAYPEMERYSIGWRMGYGEYYIIRWGAWFRALTETEKKTYQELFPEPVTWKGYWNNADECFYYQRGEYLIQLWNETGTPSCSVEQIHSAYSQGRVFRYTLFWKPEPSPDGLITESCLGQWWKSDFWSVAHTYCCMEQFMLAQKAELFGDDKIREEILTCSDPKTIKALGRKVKNFEEAVWNQVKYSIVLNGNFLKFTQNPELRNYLLSTGDRILVEASPLDGIWGIRMGRKNEHVQNPLKWKGQNLLGFALMEVRDEIRRVWKNAALCETIAD